MLVVAACGGQRQTASGIVISVTGSTPAEVSSFSLRTAEGELLEFGVGRLQTGGLAFPAAHLRDHLASASPVEVVYELQDGRRVAIRLSDATH
jgi:hypothetical protein